MEWNVESRTLSDDGSHIRCLIGKSGTEEAVKFAYVYGCDGASSTVLRALNLTFRGGTYDQVFYVADVTIAGYEMNFS